MNFRPVFPLLALFVVVGSVLCAAQNDARTSDSPSIYAESFRHGSTRITEESFEANLNPQDATYRERIKDSHGTDRYELSLAPQGPVGDTKITSWRVALRDLHHSIYDNILVADQEPSADPKNNLYWLNPSSFASVPPRAKRIIKVDGFYVTIQVKAFHFTPTESPYLDSMSVQFAFTNSDPRSANP